MTDIILITNFIMGWKVEASLFCDDVTWKSCSPIERPGLALDDIGKKIKEWENGIILIEI